MDDTGGETVKGGWGSPPAHRTGSDAPDERQSYCIRDEREEESTKKDKRGEDRGGGGGGGLRKPRLRSRILSQTLFTASHVEDRERKGRNKKTGARRGRRGAAKRPWQYPQRLSLR